MTDNFLPYARQSITEAEAAEVAKALSDDIITRGPKVAQFEQAVASYCKVNYGVAFNSATAALQAACFAAEVSNHDRLITSPNGFISSLAAGLHYNATPVFIDIDSTGNFKLDQLEPALDLPMSRGRPIILPVHFAGVPVDMEKLDGLIKRPDAVVIEDAAHALGSSYSNGQKVGCCAWSQMTIFSFHPAKNMTTGEGGMVMTNDANLYQRLRLFRNNCIERDPQYMHKSEGPWYYEVKDLSGNFNLTDFQAALGLAQLKRLDAMVAKRQLVMDWYRQRLRDLPHVRLLNPRSDSKIAFHLCVVRIDFAARKKNRSQVMELLKADGVGTQVHYIPLYQHPCIAKLCGDLAPYFPEMERYYTETLSLPLYVDLTEQDVDRVCNSLKRALAM